MPIDSLGCEVGLFTLQLLPELANVTEAPSDVALGPYADEVKRVINSHWQEVPKAIVWPSKRRNPMSAAGKDPDATVLVATPPCILASPLLIGICRQCRVFTLLDHENISI
jgi:hypothetical protein